MGKLFLYLDCRTRFDAATDRALPTEDTESRPTEGRYAAATTLGRPGAGTVAPAGEAGEEFEFSLLFAAAVVVVVVVVVVAVAAVDDDEAGAAAEELEVVP